MKTTNLKLERIRANLLITDVAKKIGTTKQAIHQIENNKCKPSYDVLIKICKLFNVNTTEIEQLFAVVDDTPNSK